MDESGLLTRDVTCESYFGFLCDSQQPYVEERNWTVDGLLQAMIDAHNSQVEEYKRFKLGRVTVTDPNNNLYCGIQRKNTWEEINEKLVKVLGGELQFRVEDDGIYLDYLTEIGGTKSTEIALSRNMQSITNEKNPTEYITRLIPLGCKLKKTVTKTDDKGKVTTEEVETEERLDISAVNDGKNYIDDESGIARYGVHVGYVEYDDVTDASNLLQKGQKWLVENNKVQIKYVVKALDLSLLGLEVDDFCVGNYHPLKNHLLGISDTVRIIKKTTDICEEVKSSFEIGEKFKTASEIQIEQAQKLNESLNTIKKIESDYVTNKALTDTSNELSSLIQQTADNITLHVSTEYTSKAEEEEYRKKVETELQVLSNEIIMRFTSNEKRITEVEGAMTSEFAEIYKYISFAGGVITLGEAGNEVTLTIDNDMICFKKNGVTMGYWNGNDFYTGNIIIQLNERLQFGNFAFVPRSDGSVMLLKVGD